MRAMHDIFSDPAAFLKRYWQKRPLLVRGAFPAWRDPVSRDELAGLACEKDVESRLVMERGGTRPWQVTHGPQRASQLRKLPRSHWTLLVQGVDRLIPGVADLLEPFRFIPDWRVDDVMVSFAPRGGTVGPHIDSYDVFLIQGQGRRRWRIDSKAPPTLKPGLDLRILRNFHAEADWILEPGDMLYLPPNLAHYGVALEECLTYSVGFRSPGAMDLLALAQEHLMQTGAADIRYRDPGLKMARQPGEIPRSAIRELRRLMEGSLQRLGNAEFDALVGELLTEPKGDVLSEPHRVSDSLIHSRLKKGSALVRSPHARMGFIRQAGSVALFVNGQKFPLGPRLAFAAPLLTGKRRLQTRDVSVHLRKPGFVRLLAALVGVGAFQVE